MTAGQLLEWMLFILWGGILAGGFAGWIRAMDVASARGLSYWLRGVLTFLAVWSIIAGLIALDYWTKVGSAP